MIEAPEGHAGWRVGNEIYPVNPRHGLPSAYHHVALVWMVYRNGGHLPEAGGYGDQCAWLMDAMAVIAKDWREEDERANETRRRRAGAGPGTMGKR